ncbi:MAG: hypothetical protein L3J79_03035 [Candidatus Marinimicrobia bacterium]|nr:hypothetical protein [Candidatus Neomarinimicrobiota bacterium]
MVVNSTIGLIPGATETKIGTKTAIYAGKVALRTAADSAVDAATRDGDFVDYFGVNLAANLTGDAVGVAAKKVLKEVAPKLTREVQDGKLVAQSAAERSASYQGTAPYEGIDPLKNIRLNKGTSVAQVTFREDGRAASEYFTTPSAIKRATDVDGVVDANKLNQGLQIYAGIDPKTGLQRSEFKANVQFHDVAEEIPFGQAAFGRTLANQNLNPDREPYDITSNNCGTFMQQVLESGGVDTPWMLDPRPTSYIEELRGVFPPINYGR